jgi:hypothetical protein
MFLRALALASIALACCPPAANADSLIKTVAGKNFDLAKPDGFCVPDQTNTGEAFFDRLISRLLVNAGNTAIQVFGDCRDLQRRHANSNAPIYNYMVYYYPTSTENEVLPQDRAQSRKSLCNDLHATNDATLANVPDIAKKTFGELSKDAGKVEINTTKNLGVLAEDDHGCYVGILIGSRVANTTNLMAAVVNGTVNKRKTLFVSFYGKFDSPQAFDRLLQRAKAVSAAFDAKNPD